MNNLKGWEINLDVKNNFITISKDSTIICDLVSEKAEDITFKIQKDKKLNLTLSSNKEISSEINLKIIMEENSELILNENFTNFTKLNLNKIIECKKNSKLEINSVNIFNGNLQNNTICNLNEKFASINLKEINFGKNESDSSVNLNVIHNASETKSKINIKNVMKDNSKNYINANMHVSKNTKDAQTSLEINSLLLDENSRSNLIPGMEVETSEVNASHAATVSTIEEDNLFYLTTRGLSIEESKKELTKSFLLSLINTKTTEKLIEGQWKK